MSNYKDSKQKSLAKLVFLFDHMQRFPEVICEKSTFEVWLTHLVSNWSEKGFLEYVNETKPEILKEILLDDRTAPNSIYKKAVDYGNTRVLLLLLNEAYKIMNKEEYLKYMNPNIFIDEVYYLYDTKFLKHLLSTTNIRPKTLISTVLKSKAASIDVKSEVLDILLEYGCPYTAEFSPLTQSSISDKYKPIALKDYLLLNEGIILKKNISEIFILLNYLLKNKAYDDLDLLIKKYDLIKSEITDSEGYNILHYICRYGNLPLCELFIQENPNLLNQTNQYHMTPLNISISNSQTKIINFLKEKNAEYNEIDLFEIPDDIFVYISCFLPLSDISNLKLVNQHFYKISNSEVILQFHTAKKFGYQSNLCRESWKQVYYSLMQSLKIVKVSQQYYGPYCIPGFCNKEWREMDPNEIVKILILDKKAPLKVKIDFKNMNLDIAVKIQDEYRSELLDSIRNFQRDKYSPYKQVDLHWRKVLSEYCKWEKVNSLKEIKLQEKYEIHSKGMNECINKCFLITNEQFEKSLKNEKYEQKHESIKIWKALVQGNHTYFWLIVSDDLLIFLVTG